jgi:ATP-binding cassette subfamily B protein
MTCINSYLDLFSTVLILWYGGTLAMRQDQGMTAGKLIAYQLYFNMLNGAYSSLLDLVTQLTRSAGASSRVFDLMDALPAIDIRKGKPVSKEGIRGDIALKAVDFCYQMRPEKQVLKAVSLQIPAGSVCALVGHSGGGKSTIVSLLQRMYDPTAGSVEFDGEDLFFGMVHGFEKELGYFSLKELQSLKLTMGGIDIPAVERDINWTPRRLSELKEYA